MSFIRTNMFASVVFVEEMRNTREGSRQGTMRGRDENRKGQTGNKPRSKPGQEGKWTGTKTESLNHEPSTLRPQNLEPSTPKAKTTETPRSFKP